MRRTRRSTALLIAPALTVLLVAVQPGTAYAADPTSMTNGFYADPNSSAQQWVNGHRGDGRAAAIQTSIANVPMARWFGNWSGTIGTATGAYAGAAAAGGKLPILVAYNIPNRDVCAGQSGGGAGSAAEYNSWIAAFASGIGNRPALVVLEPDALGHESCMTPAQVSERNGLLRNAVAQFNAKAPNTWVYLDIGNPGWLNASTAAKLLSDAGVSGAHGFSLNVSNFYTTGQNTTYGNNVNAALKSSYGLSKPYVVDTSRNGNGSDGNWCNPAGRRIGTPTQKGGGAEMLLWVKAPGESDGNCGTGAGSTAGQFLPEVAYKMIYGY
ncbi:MULTISPECIES: glycoside hydrolase family 6 protein [unclassified Kitasatospora]|uniref:glycoside hydrolase family 6 protein n=1 Tax=unclassified Kitasatospora TaxID=2633591 RepID=UPI000709758D|nr:MULTISPECIES: glycoside hydrolase family 6 protein [unclassified Kitasatospora]KQV14264.1 endoglucanase [Kitasatospora sp. Root107]KRB72404.1 endoglucanase [Kitasatospora sp. Root187]